MKKKINKEEKAYKTACNMKTDINKPELHKLFH